MSRFAVTGGAGFVGSHLIDILIQEGHNVVSLDNLVTGSARNLAHLANEPRLNVVETDISDGFPAIGKVDGVYHLASPASPIDFVDLAVEIMKAGSLGTLYALEFAKANNAWFLMASTSEAYGDPLEHPQRESYFGNVNPIGVRGVYDEAKRFGEALTMAFHRKQYCQTSIVRIFNTYGPRMRPNDGRVIPNFFFQALKNEPLTVYGDGSQTRSLCFVADLVRGLYQFWVKKPEFPVNLGNNREMTIKELAEKIISVAGSSSPINFKSLPEGDPKKRCPDISRAKEELDWVPKVKLGDGLRETLAYFEDVL